MNPDDPDYVPPWEPRTKRVLAQVMDERRRQETRYGHVNDDLLDGTGPDTRWLLPYTTQSAEAIQLVLRADYEEYQEETGLPTWVHLVREEVAEAFQETDPVKLQEELLQVAALCVSWVERIQARRLAPAWD